MSEYLQVGNELISRIPHPITREDPVSAGNVSQFVNVILTSNSSSSHKEGGSEREQRGDDVQGRI